MDIAEIIYKKQVLEAEVFKLLLDFERETKTQVNISSITRKALTSGQDIIIRVQINVVIK